MKNMQKGSAVLWVILILVIIGSLAYYFYRNLPTVASFGQEIKTDQQRTNGYEQQVKNYYK